MSSKVGYTNLSINLTTLHFNIKIAQIQQTNKLSEWRIDLRFIFKRMIYLQKIYHKSMLFMEMGILFNIFFYYTVFSLKTKNKQCHNVQLL